VSTDRVSMPRRASHGASDADEISFLSSHEAYLDVLADQYAVLSGAWKPGDCEVFKQYLINKFRPSLSFWSKKPDHSAPFDTGRFDETWGIKGWKGFGPSGESFEVHETLDLLVEYIDTQISKLPDDEHLPAAVCEELSAGMELLLTQAF
jgi:hypothetical protein